MSSKYRIVLAVFAVALTTCAMSASAALAAPEWYSGANESVAQWKRSGSPISETVPTKFKGKVTIVDSGLPASVECEETGEGSVGSGGSEKNGVGKETKWTLSGCKSTSPLCKTVEEASAVHLPWHNELSVSKVGIATVVRDKLTEEAGKGAPGFQLKCKSEAGVKVTDTCTASRLSTSAESEGRPGVEATFAEEEPLNCTASGVGLGNLQGTRMIESTTGAALEVGTSASFTKLTSALKVTDTGELALEDKVQGVGVKCVLNAEGTVEAGGKGTVTHALMEHCGPTGANCPSLASVEVPALPWSTELFESGGSFRDRLLTGTNSFRFVCSSPTHVYLCSLNVSPTLSNSFEGIPLASFAEGTTNTSCSGDEKEGQSVWRGAVKIVPPSGVLLQFRS